MRTLTAALVVGATLAASPVPAYACTCVILHDTCRPLSSAAAIFEATVESIASSVSSPFAGALMTGAASSTLSSEVHLVTLREVKSWRGSESRTIVTASTSAACGYEFKVGTRYLIVADRVGDHLVVTRCGLTRPLAEARGLIEYLQRAAAAGAKPLVEVWGDVRRAERWVDFPKDYVPVAGARVDLRGPTHRSILTGADGRYTAANLPPGRYTVTATTPQDQPLGPMRSMEIEVGPEPEKACVELDFVAPITSAISGVVTDQNGAPLRGVFVTLRLADQQDLSRGAAGLGFTTDAEGRYQFNDLPPGRYQVGVRNGPFVEASAATTEGATVITLPFGGRITLAPLPLRRRVP